MLYIFIVLGGNVNIILPCNQLIRRTEFHLNIPLKYGVG